MTSADYRSDVDGLLVDPFVDGAAEPFGAVPPDPPLFGQSPFAWPVPFGAPLRGVVGAVEPPPFVPGVVWVPALGAGEEDGSAAKTTAAPPTPSRPTARTAVATSRRAPPSVADGAGGGAGDAAQAGGGENDAGMPAG